MMPTIYSVFGCTDTAKIRYILSDKYYPIKVKRGQESGLTNYIY